MIYVIKESAVFRQLVTSSGTIRVLAGTRVFKTIDAAQDCMDRLENMSDIVYEIFGVRAQWSDVNADSEDSGNLKKDKPLASIDSFSHMSIDLDGEVRSSFDDG